MGGAKRRKKDRNDDERHGFKKVNEAADFLIFQHRPCHQKDTWHGEYRNIEKDKKERTQSAAFPVCFKRASTLAFLDNFSKTTETRKKRGQTPEINRHPN